MTTAALDDTATVRDLLFGDVPDEPTDVLAKSLREHGTIRALIPGLPGLTAAVDREVAAATDGLPLAEPGRCGRRGMEEV